MKYLIAMVVWGAWLTSSAAYADVSMPFELPQANMGASTYKTVDHPNAVFVIANYFNGCPHCHNDAPDVNKIADDFKSEPRVQVLDLGIDRDDSEYQDWISSTSPNHPVLEDGDRKVTRQLGTQGYPHTYVLDCKGKVVDDIEGEMGSSGRQQLEQSIRTQLAQNCQ